MPADPFASSAVSSQRSVLAAQFSRSAVSVIPSKPGRAQGWDPGPGTPKKGPPGPPRVAQGPRGPGGPSGPLGGKAPSAPLGSIGAIGIIPKLFRMGLFYDFISRVGGKRGWTGWSPFSWPWTKLPNQSKVNDLGQGLNGEHFWCLRLEG